MDGLINFLKGMLVAVGTWALAVLTNYHDALLTLFVGFMFNILMGIGADVNILKHRFDMKKALQGLKLLLFYFTIIIFVSIALAHEYADEGDTIIRWLTYIVGYFYITNIFRNARIIFPKNKSVEFIYLFLSTEVILKLKEYLGFRNLEKKEDEDGQENN